MPGLDFQGAIHMSHRAVARWAIGRAHIHHLLSRKRKQAIRGWPIRQLTTDSLKGEQRGRRQPIFVAEHDTWVPAMIVEDPELGSNRLIISRDVRAGLLTGVTGPDNAREEAMPAIARARQGQPESWWAEVPVWRQSESCVTLTGIREKKKMSPTVAQQIECCQYSLQCQIRVAGVDTGGQGNINGQKPPRVEVAGRSAGASKRSGVHKEPCEDPG
jgi:hypothetical protein